MSLVDGGGGGSGSTRKTHIQRIYKNDDPDTGLWVDIERIDELTYTSGIGFAEQTKTWKFDWSSFDPNGDGVSKKKIQDPNDDRDPNDPDALVISVPVRNKLVVTQGANQQYQQYNHFFVNDNTNSSRETHSRRVYHYDVSDDKLDGNKNPPRNPQDYLNALGDKDSSQYLEVEILDRFWTNEKESRDSHGRIKPSTWQAKKWIVANASDTLLHDRDGDTSKDGATINPGAGPQVDPPWRLDPLQNIVNVCLANNTFVGGLAFNNIHYAKVGKTKKQKWQEQTVPIGDSATGSGNFTGCSFAKVVASGGDKSESAFILPGTAPIGPTFNYNGLVFLRSTDGKNWQTVLHEPPDNEEFFATISLALETTGIIGAGTQKFCFAVVWNPNDKMFYAGVQNRVITVEQQLGPSTGFVDITLPAKDDPRIPFNPSDPQLGGLVVNPTGTVIHGVAMGPGAIYTASTFDEVYSSKDGLTWNKSESQIILKTHVVGFGAPEILAQGPTDDNGNYNGNLLANHCSDRVLDQNGVRVPDGVYGYDKNNDILITPEVIPPILYGSGGVDPTFQVLDPFNPENGGLAKSTVKITKIDLDTGKKITKTVDTGIPQVWCVAFAGGVWQAAGGDSSGTSDNRIATSIDDGDTWTIVVTGSFRVNSMCGGVR